MATPDQNPTELSRLAERLANRPFLARRLALIADENVQRSVGGAFASWRRPLRIAATLVIVSGLVWFFVYRLGHYFHYQDAVQSDPLVYDLTKTGVEWDVFYGHSQRCGNTDCLLLPDTPAAAFQKRMVLPAREFPLKNYRPGDLIYLRTTVTLPENLRKLKEPIALQSLYVWADHYTFYVNGVPLQEGGAELLDVTLPKDLVSRDAPLHLALKIDPGTQPYQGLANRDDVYIGPKRVLKTMNFDAYEFRTVYFLWFILPKLTFSLVFALLFLAVSRHAELFTFIVFSGLSTLDAFLQSQYPKDMLPPLVNWQVAGLVVRCFVAIAFMRFVHDFYRRRSPGFLLFQRIALALLGAFAVLELGVLPNKLASDLGVLASEALRLVSYGYANYVSALMLVYLTVTGLSRFRQRVALAFTILCIVALAPVSLDSGFKILEVFGMAPAWGGFPLTWMGDLVLFLFLAGVTAMEFGLTVSAREVTQARIEALEGRLELALTVQRLLLPRNLSASGDTYSYRFVHEPAEQMSGDWINIWQDEASGEVRLLFGDVVGKGPQAALAVSAIAGLLSDAKTRGLSMDDCLAHVNDHLRHLFHGHIYSTLAAIVLRADRQADLYCAGSAGWLLASPTAVKLLPLRGAPLGVNRTPLIGRTSFVLEPAMWALSFTDGCLEGPRAMKRLQRQLGELSRMGALGSDAILSSLFAIGLGDAKVDDRTAVVVSGSPSVVEAGATPPADDQAATVVPLRLSDRRGGEGPDSAA